MAMFMTCPITGKKLVENAISGNFQPASSYDSDENPSGLNDRIKAAGYNPDAFYIKDNAVPSLAEIIVDGKVIAKIEPSRNRGRFGGWQIVPLNKERNGILLRAEIPKEYEIRYLI